jgi:hypothetical protein
MEKMNLNKRNVEKAETMIEKVMIPMVERTWEHGMPIYKAQMDVMLEMPIFKQMIIQYLMIVLAIIKDIQESTTWMVIEKFYAFIMRGLETASALLGISKFNGLSLLQKLFPKTMVELSNAENLIKSLHGKIVVDPQDPENIKYEPSEFEKKMEQMMENPELEIHMNAIMAIMKEYEPIMDGLDDAKEGEKEKSEMDTLARTINQQYNA